jgi:hypothetical protein
MTFSIQQRSKTVDQTKKMKRRKPIWMMLVLSACALVSVGIGAPGCSENSDEENGDAGTSPETPTVKVAGTALNTQGYRQYNLIGTFDSADTYWRLKLQPPGTVEDKSVSMEFHYGYPGDTPLVGDWDGDGFQTHGVWRAGLWLLSNTLGAPDPDPNLGFYYGDSTDKPIVGDWDGNGTATPGVFRNGVFYLRNTNSQGAGEISVTFGAAGDIPLAGDWDGDGIDTVGVYHPSNYTFYLINANTSGRPADITYAYGGQANDQPILGDWNNSGRPSPGIKRGNVWHLRNGFGSNPIFYDVFGAATDIPIVGNWTANKVNNQGYLSSRESWSTTSVIGSNGTYFADVTGDGKDDMITSKASGLWIRPSLGLSLSAQVQWTTTSFTGTYGTYFIDVTGDKKADGVRVSTGGVYVRPSNGADFLASYTASGTVFRGSVGTYMADVDGDGLGDMIAVNSSNIKMRRFTSCTTAPYNICLAAEQTLLSSAFTGYAYTFFADVTGDGKADAIGVNTDGSAYVRRGNGSTLGTLETWSNDPLKVDSATTIAAVIVRDFTGDGAADLVVVNSNEVYMRRSHRAAFGTNEKLAVQASIGTLHTAAEFTGNGRPELVDASSSDGLQITRSPGHRIGLRFIQFVWDGYPGLPVEKTTEDLPSIDREIEWSNKAYAALDIEFFRAGYHAVRDQNLVVLTDGPPAPVTTLESIRDLFNPGCYVADLGDATRPDGTLTYEAGTESHQMSAFATRCASPGEIIIVLGYTGGTSFGFAPTKAKAVIIAADMDPVFRDWTLAHELGHFFGLFPHANEAGNWQWDQMYYSPGPGQFVGFKSRLEADAYTGSTFNISTYHATAGWCYSIEAGCHTDPSGLFMNMYLDDSSGGKSLFWTGDDLLKGSSWHVPGGATYLYGTKLNAAYNVMAFGYKHAPGLGIPGLSPSQIEQIRRGLTLDVRSTIRDPNGIFMRSGRPSLGMLP